MSPAVCGFAADGGQEAADTFARDQHPDQKVDTPLQRVRLGRGEIRRGPPLAVRPATGWQRQHAWLPVVPASDKTRRGRDRRGETLFMDARQTGRTATRVQRVLTDGGHRQHCRHSSCLAGRWQAVESPYGNVPGFC